jgi:hypothetical protein
LRSLFLAFNLALVGLATLSVGLFLCRLVGRIFGFLGQKVFDLLLRPWAGARLFIAAVGLPRYQVFLDQAEFLIDVVQDEQGILTIAMVKFFNGPMQPTIRVARRKALRIQSVGHLAQAARPKLASRKRLFGPYFVADEGDFAAGVADRR